MAYWRVTNVEKIPGDPDYTSSNGLRPDILKLTVEMMEAADGPVVFTEVFRMTAGLSDADIKRLIDNTATTRIQRQATDARMSSLVGLSNIPTP